METAGKHTAVEPVQGTRSISNGLTIPAFRAQFASRPHEMISSCRTRRSRTQDMAGQAGGVGDLMRVLSDYGGHDAPRYNMINGGMGAPCMHGGGLLASAQTVGSWVSELRPEAHRHWVTATSIPSLSLFKPVLIHEPVDLGNAPTDRADTETLWWKHERLCRRVFKDLAQWMTDILQERDAIQHRWLRVPPATADAFGQHHAFLDRWLQKIPASGTDRRPWYVRRYWAKHDRMAGILLQ